MCSSLIEVVTWLIWRCQRIPLFAGCWSIRRQCQACGKMLSSKYALQVHMRDVHSDVKRNYSCAICNKVYASQNSYRVHMSLKHRSNASSNASPFSMESNFSSSTAGFVGTRIYSEHGTPARFTATSCSDGRMGLTAQPFDGATEQSHYGKHVGDEDNSSGKVSSMVPYQQSSSSAINELDPEVVESALTLCESLPPNVPDPNQSSSHANSYSL